MSKVKSLDYIECAGVRVPANYSLKELRVALKKRGIAFANEGEIQRVFGEAIELKRKLQTSIRELEAREAELSTSVAHEGVRLNDLLSRIARATKTIIAIPPTPPVPIPTSKPVAKRTRKTAKKED